MNYNFTNELITAFKSNIETNINSYIADVSTTDIPLGNVDSNDVTLWLFNPYYNSTPAIQIIPGKLYTNNSNETMSYYGATQDVLIYILIDQDTTDEVLALSKLANYSKAMINLINDNEQYSFKEIDYYSAVIDSNNRKWSQISLEIDTDIYY